MALLVGISAFSSLGAPTPTTDEDPPHVMRQPDHFAWDVFARISDTGQGDPDDLGWEHWVSQLALYADPTKFNFPDELAASQSQSRIAPNSLFAHPFITNLPVPGVAPQVLAQHPLAGNGVSGKPKADLAADEQPPLIAEDVFLNAPTVKYILDNDLISQEGQEDMATKKVPIDFPKESIEVKAMWIELKHPDVDKDRYVFRKSGKIVWGLIGLHITTKDIPNWFWATFEHEDNYKAQGPLFESHDAWGVKDGEPSEELISLLKRHHLGEKIWKHYRLGGSQVSYTDAIGRPIILGNNVIEGPQGGHPTTMSSCINCHARSTVGNRLDFKMKPDGVGVPNPWWFAAENKDGSWTPTNVQRDFVWSLIMAKRKSHYDPEAIFTTIAGLKQVSYNYDIRPLFRDADVKEMIPLGVDLLSYSSVKSHAQEIFNHFAYTQASPLPHLPTNQPRWSPYLLAMFQKWISQGAAEGPHF